MGRAGMYRKAIIAALGILTMQFGIEFTPEQTQAILNLGLAIVTIIGVYAAPNDRPEMHRKK